MKKLFATFMLLMCVSAAFAGSVGSSDVSGGNPKDPNVCHDASGKWDPKSKNCDPNACGCLFHQIEHFITGLFG